MKSIHQKFLFLVLILGMLLSCMFSMAEENVTIINSGSCGDNVTYQLDSAGKLTISGEGEMTNYDLGHGYRNRPWQSNINNVKSIEISEGVTSVGSAAFLECGSLTSIVIPESVTSIGSSAFSSCSSLTSITLPESVTSIGSSAFEGCSSLTGITLPEGVTSIGDYAFYNCSGLTGITIPEGVTSIGNYAFEGCRSLTSITIPDTVTSIGNYAFSGCSSLTGITLPEGVTSIGDYAFDGCPGVITAGNCGSSGVYILDSSGKLTISGKGEMTDYSASSYAPWDSNQKSVKTVEIKEGVTSIGSYAFNGCSNLTGITLPEGVTSIGSYAFCNCSSLTSITLPESVTSISNYAFRGCSSLTGITLPEGVTSIGDYAFYNCSGLTGITIPEGVTSIGKYAFAYCSSLTSITLPESGTSIGDCAFIGCPITTGYCGSSVVYILDSSGNLTISGKGEMTNYSASSYAPWASIKTVEIKEGVTSIGNYAFNGCSNLTGITIPESVTSIGSYAFYNCSSLASITIPESVTSIWYNAFSGCPGIIKAGNCGSSVVYMLYSSGKLTIWGKGGMTNYYGSSDVPWGSNRTSVKTVEIKEGVTSIGSEAFWNCSSLTSITIPEGVTSIGDYAFCNCSNLTGIALPEGVTSIGSSAFEGCSSLTGITLPEGVTSIGSSAFEGCSSLTGITLPESVTYIGDYAFCNCSSLTDITIPEGVASIWNNAFRNCSSLTSITISEGVTSIWDNAFRNCSSLTSITLPEGVTYIGNYAFEGCRSLTSITIPDTVTSIGNYAFSGCSSLTGITLPESVTYIGDYAFCNCSSFMGITIPDSVTSIGDYAFNGCSGLNHFVVHGYNGPSFGVNIFTVKPTFYCYESSNTDFWAAENMYNVVYLDYVDLQQPLEIVVPESCNIEVGNSTSITPNIFPKLDNLKVEWISSNPEVVSAENGLISALGVGEAAITVKCGNVSDTMLVKTILNVQSFDLSASEFWIISKDTVQLSINNKQPANATSTFSWTSSDTSVFEVSDTGLVYAKTPGTATLTVQSDNGISRSCIVHVCMPVKEIDLNPEEMDIPNGASMKLNATVSTGGQNYLNRLVQFESSNSNVASVNADGLVTAVAPGTATITVSAASGIKVNCTVIVRESALFILPASVKLIEAEAFMDSTAEVIILPDGCESIGAGAFKGSEKLLYIEIPASVTDIDETAFNDCNRDLVIITSEGSAAEAYAAEHSISCIIK